MPDLHQIPLPPQVRFGGPVRAQRVRVGRLAPQRRVAPHLIDLADDRSQRPPAEPTPQPGHHQRGVLQVAAAVGLHGLVQGVHPQVGRDRVEPAAVHDPRSGGRRHLVVPVGAGPLEQHLPAQVHVVGPGLGAGPDQRPALAAGTARPWSPPPAPTAPAGSATRGPRCRPRSPATAPPPRPARPGPAAGAPPNARPARSGSLPAHAGPDTRPPAAPQTRSPRTPPRPARAPHPSRHARDRRYSAFLPW